jgi:hypothetical protein
MAIYFFSPGKLASGLANGEVSDGEKISYMFAGIIFSIVATYSTVIGSNAGRTWLGLIEFTLILATTIYGFSSCYNSTDNEWRSLFISDFVCLSLPIGVIVTLFAWGGYWTAWTIFQQAVLIIPFEAPQTVDKIVLFNNKFPPVSSFIIAVSANYFFYSRMAFYLARINTIRRGSVYWERG